MDEISILQNNNSCGHARFNGQISRNVNRTRDNRSGKPHRATAGNTVLG